MQGSKFSLSVSPGQVDFPPDNNITNIYCPSDNLVAAAGCELRRSSIFWGPILTISRYYDLVRHELFYVNSTQTTTCT